MKQFFKSNYQHLIALAVFIIIVLTYFSPQFDGMSVKQGDVTHYIGASNEAYWFKDATGEEQLWTNSMYGGMPTTQISLIQPGNFIGRGIMNFINWFPAPAGMVFLHLLCFYIMLLCFKVNRWIAVVGAIAFAFATYEIGILGAGHNSKSLAVAFMAPVIGGFYLAYRHKMWLGIGLSALFMVMEISCNHIQVTYYLGLLLVGLGIGELIRAIRTKELKKFSIASGGILVGYILAVAVNYGNISMTNEYAATTIRGGNDLTKTPTGELNAKGTEGGLDKDYITHWSYGKGESFTLLSPYVKGGGSVAIKDTPHADLVDNLGLNSSERNAVLNNYSSYWGEQPGTFGPVYVGVIMIFLAFMGLVFLKDSIKWPLFIIGVIALMLSWGKNFMGFTEFWLDNVPGYNKFRTVTIILVLIELIVPLIAVLFLDKLMKERESFVANKKKFLISSGIFIAFLFVVKFAGLSDNYTSSNELVQMDAMESQILSQLAQADPEYLKTQVGIDVNNPVDVERFVSQRIEQEAANQESLKLVRAEMFNSSMNRSLLFAFLAFCGMALVVFATSMPMAIGISIVGLFAVVDLMGVSVNYLSKDEKYWMDALEKKYPFVPSNADNQILQMETQANPSLQAKIDKAAEKKKREIVDEAYDSRIKNRIIDKERFAVLNANTNYRVFDFGGNFNSAEASYYHKSIGGYHGAKLRTIQNMIEFHIGNSNNAVLNMMNIKYFIQSDQTGPVARPNPTALGPVWFVQTISKMDTRDDEIGAMGKIFNLENKGDGQLTVNGKPVSSAKVRGFEKVQYVVGQDSIEVQVSNGINKGMKAIFVMDANGKTNLVPEFTIAMDTANSFTQLVSMEVIKEFVPATEALITKENAKGLSKDKFTGEGEIKMKSYSPMKLEYTSSSASEQFAVFSEMYYGDGWKATIDNKEVNIYNVNYCLRGLEVPKGKHTIVFEYSSESFDKSNTISFAFSCLVLLFAGFFVWKQRKADSLAPGVDKKEN